MFDMGEGESAINFDNISDSPSVEEMDIDEEIVPEIDLDKQSDVGSDIADEKKSDAPKESKKEGAEPKGNEQKKVEEAVEAALKMGDETFPLKALLENPGELNRVQELIKNGVSMRKDYSQKTAAHADAVRAWEQSKQADIQHFQNYLSETNQVFNGSPLAFLKRSFSRDGSGQMMSPEASEGLVRKWVDQLSDQLEKGSEYDPESDMKQFEMERRLNQIETDKKMSAQRRQEAETAKNTKELTEHIVSSVLKSMPQDEVMSAFMEGMPGLKQNMVEAVIKNVDKAYDESYHEGDPTWDDKMFVDTYNFKKHWDEQAETFKKSYDKAYDAYLSKKKASSTRKTSKSNSSNANSGTDDKPWTFSRMMA